MAREQLTPETKVGVVVVLILLLFMYMTLTVGKYSVFREVGYRVVVLFDSIAGLDPQAPVKMAGVPIGRVEQIELVEGRARVTVRVKPTVQLRRGAEAAIRSTGLLGEKYLEISQGRGEPLGDGAVIRSKEEAGTFDEMLGRLGEIATDLKAVTSSLRQAIGSEEGRAALQETVTNIRDLTRGLAHLSRIVEKIEGGEGTLGRLVNDPSLYDRLNETVQDLHETVAMLRRGEGALGKLLTDPKTAERVERTIQQLQNIAGRLERGEGAIGKLLSDKNVAAKLESAIEGVSETLGVIQRLRVYAGFRNEFQFDAPRKTLDPGRNKGYFSLRLVPRPEKYYLIEIAGTPRAMVTPVGTDAFAATQGLVFSAEFGWRLWAVGARLGLMENTFGGGADAYAFRDRLQLSVDAWDFTKLDPQNRYAHLKGTVRLYPARWLFVQGGYDNPLNEDLKTAFVGGGIEFEDEDLKYMLGRFPIGR